MSKVYILLFGLCVGLSFAGYIPTGYTEITLADAKGNLDIRDALQFGLDAVLTNLVDSNNIPNKEFTPSQIYSIAKRTEVGSHYYAFDLEVKSASGVAIKTKFITLVPPRNAPKKLYFSTTNLNKSNKVTAQFSDVPVEDYNNEQVQTLKAYGLNQLIPSFIQTYPDTDPAFTVKKINSLQKAVVSSTQNVYKFDLDAYNNQGIKLKATFAITQTSSGNIVILSASYVIEAKGKKGDLAGLGNSFLLVHPTEVEETPLIKNLRTFGIQEMVNEGRAEGTIPQTSFVLEETKGVYRQHLFDTEVDYKYEVLLNDAAGTTITATLVLRYAPGNGGKALYAYTFKTKTTN